MTACPPNWAASRKVLAICSWSSKVGVIVGSFHVDREPLRPHGCGQAAGGPHQLRVGGSGVEADEHATAGSLGRPIRPGRRPSFGIGRRLVIHRWVIASRVSRLRLTLGYSGLMVWRRPRDRADIWKHNRFLAGGQAGQASLPRFDST